MKPIILGLFMALASAQSYAEFKDVKAVFCNGSEVEKEAVSRIFIDLNRSLFGLGKTTLANGTECKEVNFYSILITSSGTINGQTSATFETVSTIGKRSSCETDIQPFDGPEFGMAAINKSEVILTGAFGCEELVLKL